MGDLSIIGVKWLNNDLDIGEMCLRWVGVVWVCIAGVSE